RLRADAVELLPSEAAHAAIVVSLNLESRRSKWKRRDLRNRPGREQRDRHTLGFYVQATETRRPCEKNVRSGNHLRLAQNYLVFRIGGSVQRRKQSSFVHRGKP